MSALNKINCRSVSRSVSRSVGRLNARLSFHSFKYLFIITSHFGSTVFLSVQKKNILRNNHHMRAKDLM